MIIYAAFGGSIAFGILALMSIVRKQPALTPKDKRSLIKARWFFVVMSWICMCYGLVLMAIEVS